MPVIHTQTQDLFKVNAIDTVHINPSIMEGESYQSSVLGPYSAVPIVRFAPTILVDPTISGEIPIPSVLTCDPGVVSSSPSPTYTYQWRKDGVDIVGATAQTLTTDISMNDTELTCFVEVVNFLGTVSALSNGITVTIVEPVELKDHGYFIVTGLQQEDTQNLMYHRSLVVTGIAHEDQQTVFTHTGYTVLGIGAQDNISLYENECYAVFMPTLLAELTLINPGAELGDTTGWTVTQGTLSIGTTIPYSGTYYFMADSVDTKFYQDITVPVEYLTDLDAGKLMVSMSAMVKETTPNTAQFSFFDMYIDCLDGSGTLISSVFLYGSVKFSSRLEWLPTDSLVEEIPALTRTLRVRVELLGNSFTISCQIDDISVRLLTTV